MLLTLENFKSVEAHAGRVFKISMEGTQLLAPKAPEGVGRDPNSIVPHEGSLGGLIPDVWLPCGKKGGKGYCSGTSGAQEAAAVHGVSLADRKRALKRMFQPAESYSSSRR
mgnify:CR=1 FL=1